MGGAWVFPGGAVDEGDGSSVARDAVASSDAALVAWTAAAVRELVEETGIWLLDRGTVAAPERPMGVEIFAAAIESGRRFATDDLRYFANWITPELLPVRFDTRFFGAVVASGVDPFVDGAELVDAQWIRPQDALRRGREGAWSVAFPTRRTLAYLGEFATTREFDERVGTLVPIAPVEPRIVVADEAIEILMPGDPGFEAAAPDRMTPSQRAAVERFIKAGVSEVTDVGPA